MTSQISPYEQGLTNPQKGIWSYISSDMINPQKGIDLYNNNSIIIIIYFAVTIFQHSPLTRRVFYNIIRRERGQQHQQHDWHIYKSSKVFIIINIMIHNKEMEWNHPLHQHGLV